MAATKTRSKTTAPIKPQTAAKKTAPAAAKKTAPAAAKKARPAPSPSAKAVAFKKAAPAKTGAKAATSKVSAPKAVTSQGIASRAVAAKSKSVGAAKAARASKAQAEASKVGRGGTPEKKRAEAAKTQPVRAVAAGKNASGNKAAKDVLDFGEFPAGSVTRHDVTLCLACIFRLFTNQLGLAPRTAYSEIRRYAPTVAELVAREPQRPFFKPPQEKNPHCPYCDAPKRWHALVSVHRVEGSKASDTARRVLARNLTTKDEQFQIHEEKRTARQVFFEWLERLGQGLDFEDDSAWMLRAAREYLQRREPKVDWAEAFGGVRAVRRSQRLDAGWERDGARLFLAPPLYNDVLLVQYLVSRSHRHGGRTFEGRLTLPELVRRMRYGGQLEARGITDRDQFDVLEQLVEHLTGGDDPARLHFIIDRRDLLDKVKDIAKR